MYLTTVTPCNIFTKSQTIFIFPASSNTQKTMPAIKPTLALKPTIQNRPVLGQITNTANRVPSQTNLPVKPTRPALATISTNKVQIYQV